MIESISQQKKAVTLLIYCMSFYTVFAQNHDKPDEGIHENDPGLELVISGLSIYNTAHKVSDVATEIHLTYWATHKWAFGLGYTFVFEEENRVGHEVAALVSHKPWSFLTVNAGPSFALPNSHKDTEVSGYLEGEFAFKLGNFHSGPTVGMLLGETFRIFGGWHISYEF